MHNHAYMHNLEYLVSVREYHRISKMCLYALLCLDFVAILSIFFR